MALACVLPPSVAHADVWEYRRDGTVSLHRRLDHRQRNALAADWRPPSRAERDARRVAFDALIRQRAAMHGVDAELVHAIIEVESGYDASAVSRAGAMGLMQLMPATAARFGVINAMDPQQNIDAGIRYLKTLADQYDTLALVLAAYNAGEAAVERYARTVPPYAETQAYVDRLLRMMGQPAIALE